MLAQNFKSAADLGITEPQKEALMKTLVLLETGKLSPVHSSELFSDYTTDEDRFTGHFNMTYWSAPHKCGTAACIGGTAELIGRVKFDDLSDDLHNLFYPREVKDWDAITPTVAATALRSYLTIGDARWDLAASASEVSDDRLVQPQSLGCGEP